jgi:hypothetical protein
VSVVGDFEHLLPDVMLNAVEQALGEKMTGLATPLPSYINRVYEVGVESGGFVIVKFYRPGRWSREALQDELDTAECLSLVTCMTTVSPFKYGNVTISVFRKACESELLIVNTF